MLAPGDVYVSKLASSDDFVLCLSVKSATRFTRAMMTFNVMTKRLCFFEISLSDLEFFVIKRF